MSRLLVIISGSLCIPLLIFLFCTDPSNPFDNSNNVEITVSVPERPDSFLWKVNDSVLIEVGVYLPDLIDSIALEFGENDSTLITILPAGLQMNDTVLFSFHYSEVGQKTIKATAYLQESNEVKTAETLVDIGLKPVLGAGKKIQRPENAYLDSSFYMFVSVDGSNPITFAWYKNDTLISRSTNDTVSFAAIAAADAGNYYCIIKNGWGHDTTTVETVIVEGSPLAPQITRHPQLQAVTQGQPVSFSISATGTAPLSFQWQKNGTDISGADDSAYTIQSAVLADSGALFRCFVSNTAGADTSDPAMLKVSISAIAPTILEHPQLQAVTAGQSATFSVSASGTAPLSYQWQKDESDISSAADSAYTLSSTAIADSGSLFRCIVSNAAGADTSDSAMLIVSSQVIAPTITQEPQPQTVVEGQSATFVVTATGTKPLSYQWQKSITEISGATNETYTIQSATLVDSGSVYRCIVSNSAGSDTSENALLEVTTNVVNPVIITQPQSQIVTEGASVVFSVEASGSPSPTYQWRKGGTDIPGATNSDYQISSAQVSDAGDYTVVVTNIGDTLTSNIAVLTVNKAPVIITEPLSQTVVEGNSVTFSVEAGGTPSPTYQWKKDGIDIVGATNSSYQIASVKASDAGSYTVDVMNIVDTITSNGAVLTVHTAPVIITQPQSQTNAVGGQVNFTVAASGNPAPAYQWKKDGTEISGATNNVYQITSIQMSDAGSYTVDATNVVATVTSNAAVLTVNNGPAITTQPQSQTVVAGNPVTFTVEATGNPVPSYQWKKNGGDIPGATTDSYTIASVQTSDVGSYTVGVSNTVGTTTSSAAVLTVHTAPVISTQPLSQTIVEGNSVTFSVTSSGNPSPTFQWKKNGANISGATNNTFQIPSVQESDAGNYTADVMNIVDTVTTNIAVLTVHTAPSITTQPLSQTIVEGNSVTFSVAASGNPSPTFQWKKNGGNISGATGNSYTTASVQTSDAATYTVDVTNVVSTVTSNAAILTVHTAPSISTHPSTQTIVEGNPVSFSVVATGNPSPTCQWRKNGVEISGATSSTYQITSVNRNDAGNYTVDVSNVVSTVTSNIAVLTVHYSPEITTDPGSATKMIGESVTFSVSADGNPSLSYQWKFNGSNISGATGINYTVSSVEPSHGGNYTVTVSNTEGSVTSSAASLTVQMKMQDPRDGQIYRVVQIGDQIWMAENLNFDPEVADSSSCYLGADIYCEDYGRMYTKNTVKYGYNGGHQICPPGWHCSTTNEWMILFNEIGGIETAGKKLKAKAPIWDGDDTYNFTVFPGGADFYSIGQEEHQFEGLGVEAQFWSPDDPFLFYQGTSEIFMPPETSAPSWNYVRCIKD